MSHQERLVENVSPIRTVAGLLVAVGLLGHPSRPPAIAAPSTSTVLMYAGIPLNNATTATIRSRALPERELDSPPFTPRDFALFRSRAFERRNRWS